MEAAGTGGATSRRFAAACGALSQYVRAADHRAHGSARTALQLMPGADVVGVPDDDREGPEAGPAQLTIFYGGRVLLLDECPADRAAALLRLASGAAVASGTGGVSGELAAASTDLPVARKMSLQRFMERRKGRLAARGEPYRRPNAARLDHLALAL